jgi:hypothetical protein
MKFKLILCSLLLAVAEVRAASSESQTDSKDGTKGKLIVSGGLD